MGSPLLREAPAARIVNVSNGVGSLTLNADPAFPYRSIFGRLPCVQDGSQRYDARYGDRAGVDRDQGQRHLRPRFTKTNLNNYVGTQTVQEGAREPVRLALLGPEGPTGTFSSASGPIPW
jgi:hypothetical protein